MRGYRKFSIAALALVLAFVLAVLGKLTSDFAMVASVAVGAFHAASAYGDKMGARDPAP